MGRGDDQPADEISSHKEEDRLRCACGITKERERDQSLSESRIC